MSPNSAPCRSYGQPGSLAVPRAFRLSRGEAYHRRLLTQEIAIMPSSIHVILL
jgi:hypothetical protein